MSKKRVLGRSKRSFLGRKGPKSKQVQFVQVSLTPIMLLFVVITILPVFWGLYLAFFRCNPLMPRYPFVGLRNFKLAWVDPRFLVSLKNTLFFVTVCVPTNVFLSLSFALLINKVIHFKAFFRASYFIPTITSMVAVALIWQFIYNPSNGLLNIFLQTLGLRTRSWLGDRSLVLKSIAALVVWRGLGYNIVIFLAGLQGIPQIYYEAATIDGARKGSILWYITLPLLMPTLLFVSVMTVIGSFQVFTPVHVLTEGGPADASLVAVLYIYQNAFSYLKMGYGSALAFIVFLIILIFTLLQLRIFRRRWEYG